MANAGVYVGASVINAALPFLMLPILTRHLSPSEYGEVAVFQVWLALLAAVCGLSVHGAAGRKYYDQSGESMGQFVGACLYLLVISSALAFALLYPLRTLLSDTLGLSEVWLLMGIPAAFCNFLILLRLGQWQVRRKPISYGVFQILQSVLNLGLSLLFVVVLAWGANGRLGGQAVAILSFGVLAGVVLWRDNLISLQWRPDLMREAAAFGVPLIPHIVGAFLLLTVDRAVIATELGLEQAGYYMVAVQFSLVLGICLDSVNRAYVPWLYEKLKSGRKEHLGAIVRLTYQYFLFLSGCVVIAFAIGGDVLVFVAGEEYAPAQFLVGWLVLGQAMRGMYLMMVSYIFYEKKTGVIAPITLVCGVTNVILLLALIGPLGMLGAAYAFCLAMLAQWLATWFFANRVRPMPWLAARRGLNA